MFRCTTILFTCFFISYQVMGQGVQSKRGTKNQPAILLENGIEKQPYINVGDTTFLIRGNCKNYWGAFFNKSVDGIVILPSGEDKFLKIHGNISYNYLFNSLVDTPFAEQNLSQHIIQTNFHLLLKEKYPLRVTLSNRRSNSDYFENATDVYLHFKQSYLLDHQKEKLRARVRSYIDVKKLEMAELRYKEKLTELTALKNWLGGPTHMQEIVEEKERILEQQNHKIVPTRPGPPELVGNSYNEQESDLPLAKKYKFSSPGKDWYKDLDVSKELLAQKINKDSSTVKKYESKKEELEKMEKELKEIGGEIVRAKKKIQDSVQQLTKEINNIKSKYDLENFMKRNDTTAPKLSQAERLLISVNQFGLGRTWLDYSELTVKNISINGINIEMNPSRFYFAAAAGKVNYRFRDFIIKNNTTIPDQGLYFLRGGYGKKDGNNMILSFYDGKKSMLNSPSQQQTQRIMGMAIEANYVLNKNHQLTAEIARSSFQHGNSRQTGGKLMSKIFDLEQNTNTAFSIKLTSQFPKTSSRLSGFYRKMGADFNSFNLYPTNVEQEAYSIKWNQYLWNRKLSIDASIRKNDFVSQLASNHFSSNTIFKSLQASFRQKKLPFISVGYYPTSQLTLMDDETLMESQFNTLNAVSSYSYHLNRTGMNTTMMLTKFYNHSSDTGFIYQNALNYTITQSFYLGKFTLQTSFSFVDQQNLKVTTTEPSVSYQYRDVLTLSGSFKWNRLSAGQDHFGGNAGVSVFVRRIGNLQISYDKTYIPGRNSILRPVNIGRLGFYREF